MAKVKDYLVWFTVGLPTAAIVSVAAWVLTENLFAVITGFLLSEILVLVCMTLCEAAKRGETLSSKSNGEGK